MKRKYIEVTLVIFFLIATITLSVFRGKVIQVELRNAGLITPGGFTAVKLIEGIGKARHIVVTPKRDIYVRLAKPINGQGPLLLHESSGNATVRAGFGNYGGTGIMLYKGYLYSASNSEMII
jgi:hypothetical protein